MIDLHLHTTASDGRLHAAASSSIRAAAAGAARDGRHRSRHHRCGRRGAGVRARARASRPSPASRSRPCSTAATSTCSATSSTSTTRRFSDSSPRSARARIARARSDRRAPGASWACRCDLEAALAAGAAAIRACRSAARRSRARMVAAGHVEDAARGVRSLARPRPSGASCRASGRPPEEVIRHRARRAGARLDRAPGTDADRRAASSRCATPASTRIEVYHSDHDEPATARYAALARELGLLVTGGSDFHAPGSTVRPGSVTLPWPHWDRLLARRRR